jgi:serralysin
MIVNPLPSLAPGSVYSSVYSSGTYKNIGSAPSGNSAVDALIIGAKWGSAGMGAGANVTFSFPVTFTVGSGGQFSSGAFGYGGEPDSSGQALNASQMQVARETLQKWARVANLNVMEVADKPDTQLESGDDSAVGDIRLAMSSLPSTAWAYYPGQDNKPYGGDVWLSKSNFNNPVAGDYAYYAIMHEVGHALGLEHPHENKDNDIMSLSIDAIKYTIMSYRDYVGDDIDGVGPNFFPTTPMLYDVLALQALYGTNWNYRNGDDTYTWAPGAIVYETIWDGGGVDALSAANQLHNVELHLTAGVFSKIGNPIWDEHAWVRDNLVIAFNATIENATGSDHDDYIFGSAAGNVLTGGPGNDILRGSEWADRDVVDNDTIYGGSGGDFMSGHNGDDGMYGEEGNDFVIGDSGNDILSGGSGNDNVYGGAGNDFLLAGSGNDTLNGGGGLDEATYAAATAPINADLSLAGPRASGPHGNDKLKGIENLTGSAFADTLIGDGNANMLNGGLGNDRLQGGAGDDTLTGGGGNDLFGWTATVFNNGDIRLGGRDRVSDFSKGDALDFSAALEALLTVNGTRLSAATSDIILTDVLNASTNVCLRNGRDLYIDSDSSRSITANDYHVELNGLSTSLRYDSAADTFHA